MQNLAHRDSGGLHVHEPGAMPVLDAASRRLGVQLTPFQMDQFQTYYRELLDWNQRVNLTTITDFTQVQVLHFLDALTVALAFPPGQPPFRLLDVGSGNGLPGVALKIAFPQLRVGLLESVGKKARFLSHLVERLKLQDIEVIAGRAEDLAHSATHRACYDMVVARALADLPVLLELTLPFCRIGGCVVAMKQEPVQKELDNAGRALALLGGRLREIRPASVPELPEGRVFLLIDKVGPTPAGYPRRAGIPQKRPIR